MKKKIKYSRKGSEGIVPGDYNGEVNKNNIPHGKGECMYEDKHFYKGEWFNGKRQGKGKLTWPNNDIYDGDWKNDQPNGKGKFIFKGSTNDTYEGDVKNWDRNGFGTYIWNSNEDKGNKYVGQWKNNSRNGEGTLIYQDTGDIYMGSWKNDIRKGQGKLVQKNGNSISGIFNNDQIEGEAITKFKIKEKWFELSGSVKKNIHNFHGKCRLKDLDTGEELFPIYDNGKFIKYSNE